MFARESQYAINRLATAILFTFLAFAVDSAAATFTDAIDDANNLAGSDTIVPAAGVFGLAQIITLTSEELSDSVDANVTLNQIAGGKK